MNISEKILNKQPISREEFQELVKKTDWEDYTQRVVSRVSKISEIHKKVLIQSMVAASHHVYG